MSAASILPHQLAASILFVYAFLVICLSAKRPPKKPPQSVKLPKQVSHTRKG